MANHYSISSHARGHGIHVLALLPLALATERGTTELVVEMMITCLSDVPQDFVVLRCVQRQQCWSPEMH